MSNANYCTIFFMRGRIKLGWGDEAESFTDDISIARVIALFVVIYL
jgi:hypothetical protein